MSVLQDGESVELKLKLVDERGYIQRLNVKFEKIGDRIWLSYPFSRLMNAEIKGTFAGYKWHGFDAKPIKKWSIEDCEHNWFQILYLAGVEVYAPYLAEAGVRFDLPRKNLYQHQADLANFWLQRKTCVWAAEMGTGKTLSAITAIEYLQSQSDERLDVWWIAPRSAMFSVEREFRVWDSRIRPNFVTYTSLKKEVDAGRPVPDIVVFDEAQRLKNPRAKMSIAAAHLARHVRESQGYILAMSGSPAPKSPVDWWHICHVVRPGYLREPTATHLQHRLAVVVKEEGKNGTFHAIRTWRDSPEKCKVCGEHKTHFLHSLSKLGDNEGVHKFEAGEDEVGLLHQRMKGLTTTLWKDDCLDLPEIIYNEIQLPISAETVKYMKLIKSTEPAAAQLLIKLRELSDGFIYEEKENGLAVCELCRGTGVVHTNGEEHQCWDCGGRGELMSYIRVATEMPTPKEGALIDLLDQHAEYERLVVYAAFTGSVDRVCRTVEANGWRWIRFDGRGVRTSWDLCGGNWLDIFQDYKNSDSRICFVGHPAAAGTGLTLTASPSIVYWSNDFNAESRIQSEARIHRPSSRGANIFDLFHLSVDKYVLTNVRQKRRLQDITMGELLSVIGD